MAAEGTSTARSTSRTPSVNGAAAGWPRKDGSHSGSGRRVMRVNGAAAGWPRKVMARLRMIRARAASMGPRPDGRGRQKALDAGRPWPAASMGPRPDGRGRIARPIMSGVWSHASMGPRPDGRGRRRQRRRQGRDHVASMGPRPDGRGRPVAPDCTSGAAGKCSRLSALRRPLQTFVSSMPADFFGLITVPRAPRARRPLPRPLAARSRRPHTTIDGLLPPVGSAAPIASILPGPVPCDGPVSTTSTRSSA